MQNTPRYLPRLAATALLCCLCTVSIFAVEKDSSYQAALESIRPEVLGEQIEFLADTSLEGRESGTRGGLAAAEHLAEQFADFHVRGGGAEGGYFQPFAPKYRNVLAMIEGSDPQLRDQVIVIGAHYDHVGYGGHGSSRGPYGYVHPGADDNASGTSAVLTLARAFAMLSEPPKRSLLFAAWDAEEKGLFGSKHWIAHPTVPIEHVVAALNLDMIGRLRDDHLMVFGSRSGYGWRRLLSSHNDDSALQLEFSWSLKPNADHYPFFDRGIPVLMVHTGTHDQYHRPSDVAKFINNPGMTRITRLLFATLYDLADRPEAAPGFRAIARHENPATEGTLLCQSGKPADRLGIGWLEDATATGGVLVSKVTPGSPAERAGIRVGDRIERFSGREIHADDDFYGAVATADNLATITLRRPGEEMPLELTATLSGVPMRWGISWRVDDAEPGVVILTHVVPGSPAARAGLGIGDRIYQVGGRDFADEEAFARLAKDVPTPLHLLVERDGRLRPIVLEAPQVEPAKRAA